MKTIDYDEWVGRERRVRIKFLMDSPAIIKTGKCRVCQECREICLCHEENCPNCNESNITLANRYE